MTARPETPLPDQWRAADVDAVLRPIRTGNAFEETVERLLHAVQLGVVLPGERLPSERDLAGRLRVSRETLREAIASLRGAGYLESRRGRHGGTFVLDRPAPMQPAPRPLDAAAASELEDALKLRYVLETGAAELAARRRIGAQARARLARLHRDCCNATPGSSRAYRPADSRLHLAIAELSGSPSLAAGVADVRARTNDLLALIPLLPRNIEHSNRQHGQIVDAVLRQDADAARSAIAEHLAGTAALLRGFLT